MDAIWFSLISEGQVMLFPKLRKDMQLFLWAAIKNTKL